MLNGCYIHQKDYAQYDLCDWCVFKGNRINMFFVGQVSGLVEDFNNTGIYADAINLINVELCMVVLLIELYLFKPLSVTLTIFLGQSNVKKVQLKMLYSYSVKVNLCRIVK